MQLIVMPLTVAVVDADYMRHISKIGWRMGTCTDAGSGTSWELAPGWVGYDSTRVWFLRSTALCYSAYMLYVRHTGGSVKTVS